MTDCEVVNSVVRTGFFLKEDKSMPDGMKNCRAICKRGKRGYLGYLHIAHHILPQTSLAKSSAGKPAFPINSRGAAYSQSKARYINKCKKIANWNVNNGKNLIGLPHMLAYAFAFQDEINLKKDERSPKLKRNARRWLKSSADAGVTLKGRKWWDGKVNMPLNLPIHTSGWGHALYNRYVRNALKKKVWDPLLASKKKHKAAAKCIRAALLELEKKFFDYLVERGSGADKTRWDRRNEKPNRADPWHRPFTMSEVSDPLC